MSELMQLKILVSLACVVAGGGLGFTLGLWRYIRQLHELVEALSERDASD